MPAKFPMFECPAVLIDLDDVLSDFRGYRGWKHIGPPRDGAQEFVREFKVHGWCTILWTARPEGGHIREWLYANDFSDPIYGKGLLCEGPLEDYPRTLTIDYINQSPFNIRTNCHPAKPLADLLIDNIAWPWVGEPVDLQQVMKDLKDRHVIDWKSGKHPLCQPTTSSALDAPEVPLAGK